MKKLTVSVFLGLALSGCATQEQIFPNYTVTGDYPIYYTDIVQEKVGKNFNPEFIPQAHYDGFSSGWISCLINDKTNEKIAVVVKDNTVRKIIRKSNVDNMNLMCDTIKIQNNDWIKRGKVFSQELEKNMNNPKKDHLFGKKPENPLLLVKSFMFSQLDNPLSAEYKDVKVTKTYFVDDFNGFRLDWGYDIEVKINEKKGEDLKPNGFKTYHFLVKDEAIMNYFKSSFK